MQSYINCLVASIVYTLNISLTAIFFICVVQHFSSSTQRATSCWVFETFAQRKRLCVFLLLSRIWNRAALTPKNRPKAIKALYYIDARAFLSASGYFLKTKKYDISCPLYRERVPTWQKKRREWKNKKKTHRKKQWPIAFIFWRLYDGYIQFQVCPKSCHRNNPPFGEDIIALPCRLSSISRLRWDCIAAVSAGCCHELSTGISTATQS